MLLLFFPPTCKQRIFFFGDTAAWLTIYKSPQKSTASCLCLHKRVYWPSRQIQAFIPCNMREEARKHKNTNACRQLALALFFPWVCRHCKLLKILKYPRQFFSRKLLKILFRLRPDWSCCGRQNAPFLPAFGSRLFWGSHRLKILPSRGGPSALFSPAYTRGLKS